MGRPPALLRAVLIDVGVLRLHFVIGSANDKVPLRMTGLKRMPTSQCGDGGVEGKAHCAISVVPAPSTPLRAGSCAKDAPRWALRRWLCRRVKPRPPGLFQIRRCNRLTLHL